MGPQFHDPDSFRLTHTSREGNFFFLFRGLSPWAVFNNNNNNTYIALIRMRYLAYLLLAVYLKLSYSVAVLATPCPKQR